MAISGWIPLCRKFPTPGPCESNLDPKSISTFWPSIRKRRRGWHWGRMCGLPSTEWSTKLSNERVPREFRNPAGLPECSRRSKLARTSGRNDQNLCTLKGVQESEFMIRLANSLASLRGALRSCLDYRRSPLRCDLRLHSTNPDGFEMSHRMVPELGFAETYCNPASRLPE